MAARAAQKPPIHEPPWPSVCVKALRACMLGAAASGLSPPALLAELGIDANLIMDSHARVPHETIVAVWEEVPLRCGDPTFGLRVAEMVALKPFDIIDYVMRQCATLREKLDRLLRYQRLMHDASDLRLEHGEDGLLHLRLGFRCEPAMPRAIVEFIIGLWVATTRVSLGEAFGPKEVHFAHAAPANPAAHVHFFRAPVRFGAVDNRLIFGKDIVDVPIPSADAALVEILDRHAAALLVTLPQSGDFLQDLRNTLRKVLPHGEPDIQSIAKQMRVSTRSLQRRLQQEGTTFLLVVDGLRHEIALRYLEDPALTLTEIGFLLGFVEISSFHRAFRRWTGTSPGQYRRDAGRRPQDLSS